MLPDLVPNFDDLDEIIRSMSPMGYVIALNVRNTTPQISHVTYPDAWWEEYVSHRYILFDPIVYWGVFNTGHARWSEVMSSKTARFIPAAQLVMRRAAEHDLNFGVSFSRKSTANQRLKSFFTVARSDREVTDDEIALLHTILDRIAACVENKDILSKDEIEALELTSQGLTYDCIATRVGISSVTVKARLSRARKALGADTTIQAVMIAHTRGLMNTEINKFTKW